MTALSNIHRDSLDIIFRRISPETLKDALLKSLQRGKEPTISVSHIRLKEFDRYSHQNFPGYTSDDVENIHHFVMQKLYGKDGRNGNIFYLLTDFADDILDISKGEPLCEKQHILRWRDISLRLGQDLFTTSYLAREDCRYGNRRTYFAWPPVIRSNSFGIRELMKHGLSENHSHLNGAVPVFQLTWLSLMNHPDQCFIFEKDIHDAGKFETNLEPVLLQSHKDYQMPWSKRIQLAAWIRVNLFFHLLSYRDGGCDDKDGKETLRHMKSFLENDGSRNKEICNLAEEARFFYGKRFPLSDGSRKCLDYFLTDKLNDRRNEGYHRLLVGERYFLYNCFCLIFDHDENFGRSWQDLLYLYLLLKSSLRSEMVQMNRRMGFRNFSYYQNRKTMFWEKYKEYWAEGYRMAINGTIRDNHLNSLEVRIMPSDTERETMNTVYRSDREVYFARRNYPGDIESQEIPEKRSVLRAGKDADYFYVIHFPKRKMKRGKRCGTENDNVRILPPRNENVRFRIQRQALSLAAALTQSGYLCRRIRGIDGCSAEIGCRPEVFATEFRFLRHFIPISEARKVWEVESHVQPLLSATYHVGEDFLDIADGLRAIDEAVLFLNLKRGDRLGHALALGIQAEPFYVLKSNHLVLSKQDRLDNLVWLLFRSRELGVSVPSDLESSLIREAKSLQAEIYGRYGSEESVRERSFTAESLDGAWRHSSDLQDYYEALQLRGDHPSRYINQKYGNFNEIENPERLGKMTGGYLTLRSQYTSFQINQKVSIQRNERNSALYFSYQFGREERVRGQEMTDVRITPEYADLIRRMQDGMIKFLIKKGISIECNPSSNVLIGTFKRYEEHPIFRFNRFDLDERYRNVDQLCVSVNTDDQGIFDTSLENEYALLASALEKQKLEDGMQKYSSSAILQYLYNLRAMGEMQVFPKAFQSDRESWRDARGRYFEEDEER